MYQQIVRKPDAFPALVAIHAIVTADDTGNLARCFGEVFLEIGKKAQATFRIGISAIRESVNKKIFDTLVVGDGANTLQVLNV